MQPPTQNTDNLPTNKQELSAYIKAVFDASSLNNSILIELAAKRLNELLATLPENWISEKN